MIATEDGWYESAGDCDEETLALITHEEHGGDDSDHKTQYMAPDDADRYECLVAQLVLSVQVTQAEKNQRHNLFHTKGVVKERSVHVIRRRELQQLGYHGDGGEAFSHHKTTSTSLLHPMVQQQR